MPIILKNVVGEVNLENYLRVTAAKVSSPSQIVWEQYYAVPVVNMVFDIPNLDPENYYVTYYEAANTSDPGTLKLLLILNGLTQEFTWEQRWYTVDGPGTYDPTSGQRNITDPYLIGKTIERFFREGFRFYQPVVEWNYDINAGTCDVEAIMPEFSPGEKISIDIRYANGNSAGAGTSGSGLYSGLLEVTESTKTILSSDKNKCVLLLGSAATQSITLPSTSAVSVDDGFYFDNSVGGVAKMPTIFTAAGDVIRYSGFGGSDLYNNFWVGPGEHLLIKKKEDGYWEVRSDYAGQRCFTKASVLLTDLPFIMYADGRVYDGNELGRPWWFIINRLPNTAKFAVSDIYAATPTDGRIRYSTTQKKFTAPFWLGMVGKALYSYTDFSARGIGWFEDQMLLAHRHGIRIYANGAGDSPDPYPGVTDNSANYRGLGSTESSGGTENRVKTIGEIIGFYI